MNIPTHRMVGNQRVELTPQEVQEITARWEANAANPPKEFNPTAALLDEVNVLRKQVTDLTTILQTFKDVDEIKTEAAKLEPLPEKTIEELKDTK